MRRGDGPVRDPSPADRARGLGHGAALPGGRRVVAAFAPFLPEGPSQELADEERLAFRVVRVRDRVDAKHAGGRELGVRGPGRGFLDPETPGFPREAAVCRDGGRRGAPGRVGEKPRPDDRRTGPRRRACQARTGLLRNLPLHLANPHPDRDRRLLSPARRGRFLLSILRGPDRDHRGCGSSDFRRANTISVDRAGDALLPRPARPSPRVPPRGEHDRGRSVLLCRLDGAGGAGGRGILPDFACETTGRGARARGCRDLLPGGRISRLFADVA